MYYLGPLVARMPRGRSLMCARHQWRLFLAAYGSLLDLTGRSYARFSRVVFADARECARCQARKETRPRTGVGTTGG